MKIALLPLDERPVNTRYVQMIAEIAGASVHIPPDAILSHLRQPADTDALMMWLLTHNELDVLIVSVEMLTSGGLIASRTTDTPLVTLLARLHTLEGLRQRHPNIKIYGFNVITRIPDADYAIEEPAYWAQHGRNLHRYSQLIHRATLDTAVTGELQALAQSIPDVHRMDFTQRRLRNHQLNLAGLQALHSGLFDLLVISSDDTSEYGMGTQEKQWLGVWAERFGFNDQQLLMYPGADEVGCVLMIRVLLAEQPAPTIYVHYAIDADRERIAPYEDAPIQVTVERQIEAIGGVCVPTVDDADLIVAVNPPSRIGQEYDPTHGHFADEHQRRAPYIAQFSQHIAQWLAEGRAMVLCDVAYPNGSDPDLIAHLRQTIDLSQLSAYGAWNTAGNTIGTALAQGFASLRIRDNAQRTAQARFLLHRFVEDWGYQHRVRQAIRDQLEVETGIRDTTPDNEAQTIRTIHAQLSARLPDLGTLAQGWSIGEVRLPWHRTFEVDFDLVRDDETIK
ncbi:MAG: DUF4127 family protein [Anaerolineae bacterium]